jgi:hypothetical protein
MEEFYLTQWCTHLNCIKTSASTSKKIQPVLLTKSNCLLIFRKLVTDCSEKHTEPISMLYGKILNYGILNQTVHTVTHVLRRVEHCWRKYGMLRCVHAARNRMIYRFSRWLGFLLLCISYIDLKLNIRVPTKVFVSNLPFLMKIQIMTIVDAPLHYRQEPFNTITVLTDLATWRVQKTRRCLISGHRVNVENIASMYGFYWNVTWHSRKLIMNLRWEGDLRMMNWKGGGKKLW